MKRFLMMTAAMFVATAATAAITPESVVDTFKADGYGSIEVKVGVSQIKAEAIKDGVKVEVVYDKETGAILKQESEAAAGAATGGVEIKFEDRDFVRGDKADDDGVDDNDDDSDDSNDDSGDDSSGHGSGGNSGSGGGGSGGNSGSGGGNSGSGGGGSGSGGSGGGNSGSGNSGSGG